jgi:hypothetical protein
MKLIPHTDLHFLAYLMEINQHFASSEYTTPTDTQDISAHELVKT